MVDYLVLFPSNVTVSTTVTVYIHCYGQYHAEELLSSIAPPFSTPHYCKKNDEHTISFDILERSHTNNTIR